MKHDGETAETGADDDANPQRRRLPGGDRHQRRGHDDNGRDAQPVASPAPPLVAQQQRRLDETDLQQRHDRKQHRYQHADGDALRRRAPGDAVARLGQQRRRRRPERQRDRRDGGARNGDAEEAAGQPEPHHLQHVDGARAVGEDRGRALVRHATLVVDGDAVLGFPLLGLQGGWRRAEEPLQGHVLEQPPGGAGDQQQAAFRQAFPTGPVPPKSRAPFQTPQNFPTAAVSWEILASRIPRLLSFAAPTALSRRTPCAASSALPAIQSS